MLTSRQIDARIRQLAARNVPDVEISVRLLVPYQRVARVLKALRQPEPQEYAPAPVEPPAASATVSEEDAAPSAAAAPVVAPVTNPFACRVLDLLEKAAGSGAPCPSIAAMADRLASSGWRVSSILRALERDGVIRTAHKGPQRRITIISTGRATDWSPHPRSRGGGAAIVPAGFDQSVIDQARRLLMSRDYQVLSAGPGLYRVDGRIRTADELLSMANRSLALMNRPPLVGAAA